MSTLPLEEVVPEFLVLVLVPLPRLELPDRDDAAAKKSHHEYWSHRVGKGDRNFIHSALGQGHCQIV